MSTTTRQRTWVRLVLLVLLAVVLASAWLAVASLAGKANVARSASASVSRQASLADVVTRRVAASAPGYYGQVTYVTSEYLRQTGGDPAEAEGGPFFLFYEENHSGGLEQADRVQPPRLRIDGESVLEPAEFKLVSDSGHHRTWTVRFAHSGQSVVEFLLPSHLQADPPRWDLPLKYPQAVRAGTITFGTFLALTAGLFAALSPCLLQLTLYYLSSLAGVSLNRPSPRQVMITAVWFVVGMTAAYTVGGALAGLVGQRLQSAGAVGAWSRPIAITAGIAVVGLGLWSGAAAGAPMLCKLPFPALTRMSKRAGALGSMAMGFVFSLGCLQCFGGAIFAGLLLYAGSLGSPLQGAAMLGLFSLGVAVPFLAAAAAWSRILPIVERLQRYVPTVSLVTSVVMVAFGILMITDRFHWVSGLLVRWLPFLAV